MIKEYQTRVEIAKGARTFTNCLNEKEFLTWGPLIKAMIYRLIVECHAENVKVEPHKVIVTAKDDSLWNNIDQIVFGTFHWVVNPTVQIEKTDNHLVHGFNCSFRLSEKTVWALFEKQANDYEIMFSVGNPAALLISMILKINGVAEAGIDNGTLNVSITDGYNWKVVDSKIREVFRVLDRRIRFNT